MNFAEMQSLISLLNEKKLTLSACESLTGGLFAAILTKTPGAGQIFKGGLVVYTNEAKQKLAKISSLTLKKHGAISEECARAMAQNSQKILNSDLALSFTGNAGPTSQENKPVGLVFIALAIRKDLISQVYQFSGSREAIRKQTIAAGISLIHKNLESINK